ncbi:MAG: PEGA domain-containing protein [Ignavibacteria bacterium]|nr:PEGA domain-containing protein [Ignavibacteria bacterium]
MKLTKQMAVLRSVLFVLLAAAHFGCKTQPPSQPLTPVTGSGTVHIYTDADNAVVKVDNQQVFTPADSVLSLPSGRHTIIIIAPGYSYQSQTVLVQADSSYSLTFLFSTVKTVLLEDFANVDCKPCVNSNAIIEDLLKNVYPRTKVIAVKYPSKVPSPKDPMYLAAKNIVENRLNFYDPTMGCPSLFVDGYQISIATDSGEINTQIRNQLPLPPAFKLGVTGQVNGNNFDILVTIKCINPTGVNFSRLKMYMPLIQKVVTYPSAPGSNGEKEFYNVTRAMFGDENGIGISPMKAGARVSATFSVPISADWDKTKLAAIVYLQSQDRSFNKDGMIWNPVFQAASSD